ncbi:uncharacterized protein LOC134774617 [Penaeus indicus]|uniref:uncharacterized protein LOC134774617 n=1 Tax=Penaeus indicus TaxID=29960 RepID=UPI00300C5901
MRTIASSPASLTPCHFKLESKQQEGPDSLFYFSLWPSWRSRKDTAQCGHGFIRAVAVVLVGRVRSAEGVGRTTALKDFLLLFPLISDGTASVCRLRSDSVYCK